VVEITLPDIKGFKTWNPKAMENLPQGPSSARDECSNDPTENEVWEVLKKIAFASNPETDNHQKQGAGKGQSKKLSQDPNHINAQGTASRPKKNAPQEEQT